MITGRFDPVFHNARFDRSFAFTIDGVLIPWLPEHSASVTFRDPESDLSVATANSLDGSGRVTLPGDGIVRVAFDELTFLEPGTWEMVVMLSNAVGKMDGLLFKLPVKEGGV